MAGTDPYGLWLERPDEPDRSDPNIRPPGATQLLPPGHSVKLFAIHRDTPGSNELLAQVEAFSAIATTNAERGVDNGLGFWDSLLLSDSPLHLTLQSIGFIPGLGEPVDVIDGIIYALEGDTVNAGISLSAAIPGIGWGVTSARWGKRVADAADAVNDSVRRAADAVGPGRGAAHGTRVHSALESEIKALNRPDLRAELSFKDGIPVDRGTKGSIRLDVVELDANGLPVRVWDLKTGAAKLTPKRIEEIRKHLPEGGRQIPILPVHP
jgi:hypothetical protein